MKQLHPYQMEIIKRCLFAQELRYSELRFEEETENNRLDFHLNQLLKEDYIEKVSRRYKLTNKGKLLASRMDTRKLTIGEQPKISTHFCCVRKKKKDTEFLIYTRSKQPFYGCQGFGGGKVMYGENIVAAVKRELKEETNLVGTPQIITIKRLLTYDKNTGGLVDDKLIYLCLVKNPKGKLISNEEGNYEWVSETKLESYITKPFENYSLFKEDIERTKKPKTEVNYKEIQYFSDKF